MKRSNSQGRGGWFLPFRLATFVVLLALSLLKTQSFRDIEIAFVVYASFTLLFAVSFALQRRYNLARLTAIAVAVQFIMEIGLECGIILQTGGAYSPFSALFVLTIVSAALWYRLGGTLLVASTASIGLAISVLTNVATQNFSNLNAVALGQLFEQHETEFYSVLLHLFIFYLVAFIAGYLAERLNRQQRELESTSLALRQARMETDEILRQVSSGLLTIDLEGRIVYFNRAAESILGYDESDIRGLRCAEVFGERMPDLADRLLESLEHGLETGRREISVLNQLFKPRPIGISTSLMIDADGSRKGLVAIFSDLTEAKELEAKIRSSDRLAAVGELSASIAHEIRNPLASISGSVEILKRELSVAGENSRLMDLIVNESHRLGVILTEFLTYSRISSPILNKVELCHLVTESLHILKHHSSYHDRISLSFNSDRTAVYVLGHEDSIKQMLINLFVNAVESIGPHEGRLGVGIRKGTGQGDVLLEITDSGPGFDPDLYDQIFEPFFSTKKSGTGLGLSIVHRLAESMNLSVSVSSRLGEGAVFRIEFPPFEIPAESSEIDLEAVSVSNA